MQNNRGFTLIELMVTIAVLAIIATIAAPSFNSLILDQNLNRSTQELIGQLSNARSKAVLERRNVIVKLNSEKVDPTKQLLDTPQQLNWAPQNKAILKSGSPTEVTFVLSGGVENYATNINGKSFVVCTKINGNKSKNITISLMGTIQIIDGTC